MYVHPNDFPLLKYMWLQKEKYLCFPFYITEKAQVGITKYVMGKYQHCYLPFYLIYCVSYYLRSTKHKKCDSALVNL